MAALTYTNSFVSELAAGTHDGCTQADTDVIKYAASNTTPNVATWTDLTHITAIDVNTNSSETWPFDSGNTFADSGGTITVSATDATITATGSVLEFRYIWAYNSGVADAGTKLIGYWDNLSAVNLTTGQVFTLNLTTTTLFTVVS